MDSTRVFKFASIRKASDEVALEPWMAIKPSSALIAALVTINESSNTADEKKQAINDALQDYIAGASFIKTKAQFTTSLADTGHPAYMTRLYDNIVVRTLTKSNVSSVYKLLVDQIRAEQYNAEVGAHPTMVQQDIKILVPDGLVYSFINSGASTVGEPAPVDVVGVLANQYNQLLAAQNQVQQARAARVTRFLTGGNVEVVNTAHLPINEILGSRSVTVSDAQNRLSEQLNRIGRQDANQEVTRLQHEQVTHLLRVVNEAREDGITSFEATRTIVDHSYDQVLSQLGGRASVTLEEADRLLSQMMEPVSSQLFQMVPRDTFTLIGDQWVNTADLITGEGVVSEIGTDGIYVYANGCYLKFPFQIADLRVVEQQTVGYLPGEIAHIQNVQPGEQHTRVTRRLKRTEDYASLIEDEETFRETDSQSTEKFGFEKEASQVQKEENSWNVNASVSATYGPVSASVDGGYESSTSSVSSNSSAQSYAKEMVEKVVDRVSKKVHRERSTKTIEEFEETVTHHIDNKAVTSPKSYVYRWLNKLTRATLKNYGKRLIFQLDIAHPAHYHLSRSIKSQPTIALPQDPRKLDINGVKISSPDKITRDNYLVLADLYGATIDAPPVERLIMNKAFANKGDVCKVEEVEIPKGYGAVKGKFNGTSWDQNIIMTIASSAIGVHFWSTPDYLFRWINGGIGANEFTFSNYGNGTFITDKVAITFFARDYTINFELECQVTDEAFKAWQVKAFRAIVEGYENKKREADSQKSEFNPNLPGLTPEKKYQIIRNELKKESIRKMLRCNPLAINDKFVVGQEYQSDCCRDNANGEIVRFLESVFDWRNLTYEFYPYFYASRDVMSRNGRKISDNWEQLQLLSDSDPHFEAFLQSPYATVRIPVHRDTLKETAAVNFVLNNSIANYEVVPEGILPVLEELALEQATEFTYGPDGDPIPPFVAVDLGVFQLPTSLVILECGTQDGVKPVGFPMTEGGDIDNIDIPKQYSPAIIADSCPSI
jgi:hypothetical protein